METEIWKSHPEYAGIEVSTLGNVRSLDKVVPCRGNGTRIVKGRILNPASNNRGYLTVAVKVNDKFISKLVHRLVAQTFISNLDNLPEVNHKDCDKTNNSADNLEWVTHDENIAYRDKYGNMARNNAPTLPVFAIDLTTLEVSRFRSQNQASRALGIFQQSIGKVIKGKYRQTGGYFFVNDDGHAVDVVKSKLHDIGGVGLNIKYRKTLKTR